MRTALPDEYCAGCGRLVKYRPPSQRKRTARVFCSNACHMRTMNAELNPARMNSETREKLRNAKLDSGRGSTYSKIFGKHAHRVVAAQILGRDLAPGEVVHHVDGNKRNNSPENLMVFSSQGEHLNWHRKHDARFQIGGDAKCNSSP